MNKVKTSLESDFDFGFSVVDENELASSQEVESANERLKKMYDMIVPLLNNLSQNPEKAYIHWPDRTKKIEQFKKRLKDLLEDK